MTTAPIEDVFISYSRADTALAVRLEEALVERGLTVWRDARLEQQGQGAPFTMELDRALHRARKVIVLWSSNSVKSNWVHSEALRAWELNKLVPVKSGKCNVPVPFNGLHAFELELTPPGLDRLGAALGALGSEEATAPWALTGVETEPYTGKMPTTYAEQIVGRDGELARLTEAWDERHENVVVVDAIGGAGKTTLMHHLLQRMQGADWRGADRVYAWSFYNQGIDQQRTGSSAEFFKHALAWFGYEGGPLTSEHDRGEALANLVRARRTLLVLDGLEPMQYPTHSPGWAGHLRDEALAMLLKQLATKNPGLCIVTTRLAIPDLAAYTQGVQHLKLGRLSDESGEELLRTLGVKGRSGRLRRLVREYEGHALAVTLVGRYLATVHGGSVGAGRRIPPVTELVGYDRNVNRVMLRYEVLFEERIKERSGLSGFLKFISGQRHAKAEATAAARQLSILYLMGLFDRPLDADTRRALLRPPGIPGLTEVLSELTDDQWAFQIAALRDLGLVAPAQASHPDEVDAHALVRAYFGNQLREKRPDAWREANSLLFEHYVGQVKQERPNSRDVMDPWFKAVHHGCAAGRYADAFEVYFVKLNRKFGHQLMKMGLRGDDLTALSNFFERPWSRIAGGLDDMPQRIMLEWAGQLLLSFLRLDESQEALTGALALYDIDQDTGSVRRILRRIADVQLLRGELELLEGTVTELDEVERRLEVRPGDHSVRGLRGICRLRRGDFEEAKKIFAPVKIHGALSGLRYIEYLYASGRLKELLDRGVISTHDLPPEHDARLDRYRGQAHAEAKNRNLAIGSFERSLKRIRSLDSVQELPDALVAYGRFRREIGDHAEAADRLDEALDLAELGGMQLTRTDARIELARLAIARGGIDRDHVALELASIEADVDRLGYGMARPALSALAGFFAVSNRDDTAARQHANELQAWQKAGWRYVSRDLTELRAQIESLGKTKKTANP